MGTESIKTIGFPRMRKEVNEKRVFLPEFIQQIAGLGFEVFVEEGYGSRSGFSVEEFKKTNPWVHICDAKEAFAQDYVLVLRSPNKEVLELIPSDTCLISMLHYPTRPKRVSYLLEKKIKSISLDSIIDDNNLRLVENMKAVAWNGLEVAFDCLEAKWPSLIKENSEPWKTLILGTGMVGKHAVEAATKLGNIERNNDHINQKGPGAIAWCIGRNLTYRQKTMASLFPQIDVLVDATQRRDPSTPIVPNQLISLLPGHAVIVDLAVDPYTLDANPPVVRGIEGMPKGDLNKYIFYPDDPQWDLTVPKEIESTHRRTSITCYSWPGIHPEACMRHYGQQIMPFMEILAAKDYDELSLQGDYFERALFRATLTFWQNQPGH